MAFIDYYKILGLSKNASENDIKKAYRKLARKYHPDLNPNDPVAEKKFKEINEANEVLSHPENRKKYDAYGEHWQHAEEYEKAKQEQRNQQQYQRQYQRTSGGYSEEDFSEFFRDMFGGRGFSNDQGGRSHVRFRGQDFNARLQLDLRDVYTTHKRTLTVNGKNIRITIPAGVENGQIIKIKGYGGPGVNGGPNGDLYIEFTIANHSKFKRDKDNLYTTVDLDLYTALLGGNLVIDTFDGQVKLSITPETQNGTQVKLKGKGFPKYKKEGQFGDLYVTYQIKIPTHLTKEEKDLLKQLQKRRS